MTAANFPRSLTYVLLEEGGFVNHPRDPGGATNKGVTQAVYDGYRVRRGMPKRSVKLIDAVEVSHIYHADYWAKIQGDDIPAGLDYAVFDLAVNSGVSRASKFLQKILLVTEDGQIGPRTIAAIHNVPVAIDALCDQRQAFLEGLSTFPTFGKGWTARVKRVRQRAKAMAI